MESLPLELRVMSGKALKLVKFVCGTHSTPRAPLPWGHHSVEGAAEPPTKRLGPMFLPL